MSYCGIQCWHWRVYQCWHQGNSACFEDVLEAILCALLLLTNTTAAELFKSLNDSVQFSYSVVSDSLWPHGLQHARPSCPSPTSGVYSGSCPLSLWWHPTISSSVIPFFSHLQSFPASGSFQMSQFFTSGGHSIGVSASASVLPMNIQDWFPLGWGSQESSPTLQFKSINSSALSFLYSPTFTSIHNYWKKHSFD